MRANRLGFTALVILAATVTGHASGGIFFGPAVDPNASGGGFSSTNPDLFTFGLYGIDDAFVDPTDANDVIRVSSGFQQFGVHAATLSLHVSNGENGNDGDDPFNPDTFNFEPPHSGFADINQPDNRLKKGNVIRFSFWMKADPDSPIMVAPTIEPVITLEFWTEALSNDQDSTVVSNPQSGDRLFDTQVNGGAATYVDINGDGIVNGQLSAGPPDFSINSVDWTLISTQYVVDDTQWGYDLASGFVPKTVDDVEEIRANVTIQEFFNTDLTQGGAYFIDQPMLEIYNNTDDLPTQIPNPLPGVSTVDADFDNDLVVDCLDVNALVVAMVAGDNDQNFDLTGDGLVDEADLDEWLVQAGAANLASQNPYLKGDADLNGFVDQADFDLWNANKFSEQSAYCSGDFNGDGAIDVSDLHLWNVVKFTGSDDSNMVPEPEFYLPLLFMLPLMIRRTRDSHHHWQRP